MNGERLPVLYFPPLNSPYVAFHVGPMPYRIVSTNIGRLFCVLSRVLRRMLGLSTQQLGWEFLTWHHRM